MFDFHVHAESYNWQDMELMSLAGIKAVIGHTWYFPQTELTTAKIETFYESLMLGTAWILEMHNIRLFIACGVNPMCVPKDYSQLIDKIPSYLEKKDVFVAIGEVGLDARSETCRDMKIQEDILREQLLIGKKHKVPVVIHTPPESVESGREWLSAGDKAHELVDRDLALVNEVGIDPRLVVIDHLASREMVEKVIQSGAYAGVTIQPWRNLSAGQVVSMIRDFDPRKILISTDYSLLRSDCLGVPKVASEMKREGFSEDDIHQIVIENPRSIFRLPI